MTAESGAFPAAAPPSVRALLISLAAGNLLVPYSVVQEIIAWRDPEPSTDAPDWVLGMLDWRGRVLPVISAERLLGGDASQRGRRAHIVVCNLLNGDTKMPCVGIETSGVPQLIRADVDSITPGGDKPDVPWVMESLRYQGTEAWVPDFPALAAALPSVT